MPLQFRADTGALLRFTSYQNGALMNECCCGGVVPNSSDCPDCDPPLRMLYIATVSGIVDCFTVWNGTHILYKEAGNAFCRWYNEDPPDYDVYLQLRWSGSIWQVIQRRSDAFGWGGLLWNGSSDPCSPTGTYGPPPVSCSWTGVNACCDNLGNAMVIISNI